MISPLLKCTISLLCLSYFLAFFSGCRNNQDDSSTANKHQQFELRPESSGELSRTHKLSTSGVRQETEVVLRDGSKALAIYDSTGDLKDFKHYWPNGKLHVHSEVADQGLLIAQQLSYNDQQVLEERWSSKKNGDKTYQKFYEDGTEMISANILPDGSGECKVWFNLSSGRELNRVQTWQKNRSFHIEAYTSVSIPNQLLKTIDFDGTSVAKITYYKAGGSAIFSSYWDYQKQSGKTTKDPTRTDVGWLLLKAELHGDGGEKHYTYEGRKSEQDRNAAKTRVFAADGSQIVYHAKKDNAGEVELVERYDRQGNLLEKRPGNLTDNQELVAGEIRIFIPPTFQPKNPVASMHELFKPWPLLNSLAPQACF